MVPACSSTAITVVLPRSVLPSFQPSGHRDGAVALLGVPVHPALHRVHVDERQLARAGQQRRPPGQPGQQFPVHLLHLADILLLGERAQERPPSRRRRATAYRRPEPDAVHMAPWRRVVPAWGDGCPAFPSWPRGRGGRRRGVLTSRAPASYVYVCLTWGWAAGRAPPVGPLR